MTQIDDALERLAPKLPWQPEWSDVLRRAGVQSAARFEVAHYRRLVLALVVVLVLLIPLAALGAANDWWFFKSSGAPKPLRSPVVVRQGTWSGDPWQLLAYPSATDGLCFSVASTRSASDGTVGSMSCAPFKGIARTTETKNTPDMVITFLSGSAPGFLPNYVVGPVIGRASEVEIRFDNGIDLRTSTFDAPEQFGGIRFYATQIPTSVPSSLITPKWVAGLDNAGDIVACVAPRTAKDGISKLSDCK